MGIIEYRGTIILLRQFGALRVARPALVMAVVMALAGVVLTFGIMAKLI
jgi:hypothetical protein